MDIVRDSREVLCSQGYSCEEIKDAYIVHHHQDIRRPTDPRDISSYVKNKLELLGYNSDYWLGMELVVQAEPDMDDGGNALTDVTAYLLRRSGCTYLCNCASVPLPDGRSVMPHGLVDALMGHRLRNEDAWWQIGSNVKIIGRSLHRCWKGSSLIRITVPTLRSHLRCPSYHLRCVT